MKTWTHTDKTEWGDGPWVDEPDKIQWIDDATDLDCLIVRNVHSSGALCGYVGVPPGHSLYGKSYDDVAVEVHGGLTFSDSCQEEAPEGYGICHIPEPGRPADVWWFGFDCAHFMDTMPMMDARMRQLEEDGKLPPFQLPDVLKGHEEAMRPRYKPVKYVQEEVARLAAQLAQVA